jgi:hypothetical protein
MARMCPGNIVRIISNTNELPNRKLLRRQKPFEIAPVNASPPLSLALAPPHDTGPLWLARPLTYYSLIHYNLAEKAIRALPIYSLKQGSLQIKLQASASPLDRDGGLRRFLEKPLILSNIGFNLTSLRFLTR